MEFMREMVEKKKWYIIMGAVTVCLLAVCLVLLSRGTATQGASVGSGMRYVIDDGAVPTASAPSDSPAGIKIPGYAVLRIPAETAEVEIPLANPAGNPCYFTYEIVLSETGESLFVSDMIEPGMEIPKQSMSRSLPSGEYDTSIKIRTFSLDTYSEMNGANLKSKLVVM